MSIVLSEPATGKLTAAELDASIEPWHQPQHMRQIERERRQHDAAWPMPFAPAESCTELGADDDDAKSLADIVMDWLTLSRFWALYVLTFVGAMLTVWVVLS